MIYDRPARSSFEFGIRVMQLSSPAHLMTCVPWLHAFTYIIILTFVNVLSLLLLLLLLLLSVWTPRARRAGKASRSKDRDLRRDT